MIAGQTGVKALSANEARDNAERGCSPPSPAANRRSPSVFCTLMPRQCPLRHISIVTATQLPTIPNVSPLVQRASGESERLARRTVSRNPNILASKGACARLLNPTGHDIYPVSRACARVGRHRAVVVLSGLGSRCRSRLGSRCEKTCACAGDADRRAVRRKPIASPPARVKSKNDPAYLLDRCRAGSN